VTSVTSLLHLVLYVYSIIVFVAVILSWFHLDPRHPIVRFTAALTEPVLRPIRKVLPPVAGLDLSPLLLLLGLQLLRRLL
jgi:YggT family protein